MPSAKPKPDAVLGLALLLLTLGIRLPLWSLPPFTDEGTWLAVAYLSPWQTVLHPNTPLGLCAHLLSWLVGPGASSFAVARVADALFAGTAAWLFFLVLRQRLDLLSAGLAAALWVVAFNQPRFIDAGMKNPVAMAATCLMAALWLLGSRRRWAPAAAGVLMGLAIGLREPFVFFLLTSAGLAWRLGHGRRALAWHLLAAAGTVLAIVWIAGRGQGGVAGVVAYYQGTTHLYAELRALDSMSRPQRFGRFALESFQLTRWLVLPAAAGALALLSRRVRGRLGEAGLLALLLLVPVAPEIFNWPFPYHFAQLLFGLALLAGIGFEAGARAIRRQQNATAWLAAAGVLVLLLLLGGPTRRQWQQTLDTAARYPGLLFPGEASEQVLRSSFYYDVAAAVRELTGAQDRIVVSGFYYALYPLAGRRPADPHLLDLTVEGLRRGPDAAATRPFAEAPPALVVETTRFRVDWTRWFDDFTADYRVVAEFPPGTHAHYGSFGARIWKRR